MSYDNGYFVKNEIINVEELEEQIGRLVENRLTERMD
jgi:hypothetical protein